MLIGYARVSTGDQSLTLQIDALEKAGCKRVFQDQISGIVDSRPNLNQALSFARPGDTLVVWRLDRLSRSLRDLIETVALLESRGVQLKSLHESIDTASSSGKLIFHLFVKHSSGEYVKGNDIHINGIESFWSMLKRAHKGTYHKMSKKYLGSYVGEFAGRHNIRELDTIQQMTSIVASFIGKRLLNKQLDAGADGRLF